MTTRTAQAVAFVDAGVGPVVAARQAGVAYHVLYRALRRRADKPLCPCCKQVVRKGFDVTPAPAAAVPEPVQEMTLNAAIRTIEADIKVAGSGRKQSISTSLRALLALAGGK